MGTGERKVDGEDCFFLFPSDFTQVQSLKKKKQFQKEHTKNITLKWLKDDVLWELPELLGGFFFVHILKILLFLCFAFFSLFVCD